MKVDNHKTRGSAATMQHIGAEQASIDDQAAAWVVRLRADDCTDADRAEFAIWLADDKCHARAVDQLIDLWQDLGSLEHLPEDAFTADNVVPLHQRRSVIGGGLALAASVLLAMFMLPGTAPVDTQSYQTAMGEQREITLTDGSTVTLNTDSRLSVALGEERRNLTLHQGEAFFEVAPDADRPFTVNAGSADVTALGTAFNIYRRDDSSAITVTHGVVRVTERSDTADPSAEVLRADQSVTSDRRGLRAVTPADTRAATAWRSGELIADGMPLPKLIAELERYDDTEILIGDTALVSATVSGVFDLTRPDAVLTALAVSLDLEIVPVDTGIVRLNKVQQ